MTDEPMVPVSARAEVHVPEATEATVGTHAAVREDGSPSVTLSVCADTATIHARLTPEECRDLRARLLEAEKEAEKHGDAVMTVEEAGE